MSAFKTDLINTLLISAAVLWAVFILIAATTW